MNSETVVHSRPDREIRKKIITKGDYDLVPYEDSRCKIVLSDITCKNADGVCHIGEDSLVFSPTFDGNILIGDSDCFIDRDIEFVLQQMCSGEVSSVTLEYKDGEGKLAKEISCTIHLKDVMEEQVVSDWSWNRLYECSLHHKERGVALVKENNIIGAFRRFNKALKMLIAIEPVDPEVIDDDKLKELVDLKVKLYNNLAHCQLQFDEFEPALELCNKALKFDKGNLKALYRRCIAYTGLGLYDEAWTDIQEVLRVNPHDKAAQQKANSLKPTVEKIYKNYNNVIKKMFEK